MPQYAREHEHSRASLDQIVEFIKSIGPWGCFFLALFGFFWWLCKDITENEPSRARVIGWLVENAASVRYRAVLTRALDWIDIRLSHDEAALDPGAARKSWSAGLLGFNCVLALGYPILSLLAAWVATGAGNAGGRVLLPPEPDAVKRFLAVALVCVSVAGFTFAEVRFTGRRKLVVQLVFGGLFFAFAFAFAVAGAFAGAVAFAVAFAVAGAVAFAVAGAVSVIGRRTGRHMEWLLFWLVTGTAVASVAILLAPSLPVGKDGVSGAAIVLFASLLPLLNAAGDFASCGLTRSWLRRGIAGNLLWAGIRDTAAGAAIFILLGFAIIAAIHWVRPRDGVPLADLTIIFDGLRDPALRGGYSWLAAMLFSTLVPTLIHLTLACLSFFTLAPEALRTWIVARLHDAGRGNTMAGKMGLGAFVLGLTLSVFVPCFLCWYLFTWRFGVLDGAIAVFDWFARFIGAIPQGVTI